MGEMTQWRCRFGNDLDHLTFTFVPDFRTTTLLHGLMSECPQDCARSSEDKRKKIDNDA